MSSAVKRASWILSNKFMRINVKGDGEPALVPLWAVVENISRRVVYDGQPVSRDLAEYLLTAIVNATERYDRPNDDQSAGSCGDGIEQREFACEELPEIIEECKYKVENRPFEVLTAELQIFVAKDVLPRESYLTNVQHAHDATNYMLLQDILASPAFSQWDQDQLHKKVVSFIIRQSRLGNPDDPCVVQECAAALSSVWPDGTLHKFVHLGKEQKTSELQDYLLLSSGVRLFNREKNRGGSGIADARRNFKDVLSILADCLKKEKEQTEADRDATAGLTLAIMKGSFTELQGDVPKLKDIIVFLHQYLSTILQLKAELKESKKIADRTQKNFVNFVDKLEHTCRNERVVAADVVFPIFISLAREWTLLQLEVIRVQFLQDIFDTMQRFKKKWTDFKELHKDALSSKEVQLDFSKDKIQPGQIKNLYVRLVQKETTPKYDTIPHCYKGCCLVTLVEQDGFLINGNKNIGTLQFENKFYCFVDAAAAVRFNRNPMKFLNDMDQLIKSRLALKNLLPSDFFNESEDMERNVFRPKVIVKVDADVQTVLHPVEYHIDHNYDWNIWNIRKKAYNLYRITKCLTHSAQTDISGLRTECAVQTTMLPKNQETQTKRESFSKGVRHLQYLGGLRGGPDAYNKIRFKQINLSSDVLEKPAPEPRVFTNEL